PNTFTVLKGAQRVPAVEHTSIGWTVITLLTATDAARAAPDARQAPADKRQSHDAACIPPHLRSDILHLPLRAPKIARVFRPSVHKGTPQAIFCLTSHVSQKGD